MTAKKAEKKHQIQVRGTSREIITHQLKQLDKLGKLSDRRDLMNQMAGQDGCSETEMASILADMYGLQKIDFSEFEPHPKVVRKIPKKVCEKYMLIPCMKVEDVLVVAFSDPGDVEAKDAVSVLAKSKVQMVVAERGEIKKMIEKHYSDTDKLRHAFSLVESKDMGVNLPDTFAVNVDQKDLHPVVQSVNHIIKEALRLKSSDIHLESYEKRFRVRFRVDGRLFEHLHPPVKMAQGIISRIKVLSKMDISEKRIPQDGSLKVKYGDGTVDFRISTVPVVSGEKMVMRALKPTNLTGSMSGLGMDDKQIDIFKRSLYLSQGFILMTGPTGSGKTTTIYSGLSELNEPHRNISTVEDPVEYKLDGINQVQTHNKVGLNFASVLKSFLRQDPDVILVGEIRDLETADVAYRAAATGHLVLSTLHTNDTASTLTRLMDIGVPVYSVAENTSVILAQRLLRTLCEHCKEPDKLSPTVLTELGFKKEELEEVRGKVMKKSGCSKCNNLGYSGRVAVYEIMEMTDNIKEAIFKKATPAQIKRMAIEENGMKTLRISGLEKLKAGRTSVNEVLYGTIPDSKKGGV